METLAVAEKTRGINKLKHVALVEGLSQEYFYYEGILLVNADLPRDRILKIISLHLELPEQDYADGSFYSVMERRVNHV